MLFRKELEKEIQKRKRRDREIRKLRQQIKVFKRKRLYKLYSYNFQLIVKLNLDLDKYLFQIDQNNFWN